jgi:CheY-like chemotaxis protein
MAETQILIIEDNPQMRRLIARVLRRNDHAVLEADSGRQGLKMFQEFRPALVICDIVMPNIDGIETIRQMRRDAPAMPILAISGGSNQSLYLRAATGLGATASLEKPFDHEQLTAAMAELLGSGPAVRP